MRSARRHPAPISEITQLLQSAQAGDPTAASELLPLVYDELRRLAAARMAREAVGQTLQPTALVHEAWLRLGGSEGPEWQGRAHFFAAAAEAMRRILIDRARRRRAVRHGGAMERVDLDDLELPDAIPDDQLLLLDEVLDRLEALHPRKARVLKLRYLVGLTLAEAATVLGVSACTAKDDSDFARAWLYRELHRETR